MPDHQTPDERDDFATQAAEGGDTNLASEFLALLRDNKKWWLAPILMAILGLGVLVILGGSAAAPFIYTLF